MNKSISEKGPLNHVFEKAICTIGRITPPLHNQSVWLVILEDCKDHGGHLPADMTNHIHVVQSFGSFLFIVSSKHWIKPNRAGRCQSNGSAQVWRASLGHAVLATLKLTGLSNGWIKSRVGQQFVCGRKSRDITNLTEYSCC